MKEEYVLTALDSFVCLADKCPRDCCSRFAVQLDPDTHRKWEVLAATDANRAWLLDGVYHGGVGGKNGLNMLPSRIPRIVFSCNQTGFVPSMAAWERSFFLKPAGITRDCKQR